MFRTVMSSWSTWCCEKYPNLRFLCAVRVPSVGVRRSISSFSNVVLPAPFSPTMQIRDLKFYQLMRCTVYTEALLDFVTTRQSVIKSNRSQYRVGLHYRNMILGNGKADTKSDTCSHKIHNYNATPVLVCCRVNLGTL